MGDNFHQDQYGDAISTRDSIQALPHGTAVPAE